MNKKEKAIYWQEIDIIRAFRRYGVFYKELEKEQDLFNHYEKAEYDSCIICLNNAIEEFIKSREGRENLDRKSARALLIKLSGLKDF